MRSSPATGSTRSTTICSRPNLNQNKATLANAQQSYDRAASLSKTGSGTQATLDSAVSALRVAEAQVATSQTRLARRIGLCADRRAVQQIYFREGETVPAQRPVLSIMPPGNMKVQLLSCRKPICRSSRSATRCR